MKKVILLVAFSTALIAASYAQGRFGVFGGYGAELERWGVGGNVEIFANKRSSISAGALIYFPEVVDDVKSSYSELSGNFNYYVVAQKSVGVYGLVGLNVLSYKVKNGDAIYGSKSGSELGVNLGIGANVRVGSIVPFGELKYVLGDTDQAVISMGIKYSFAE